MLKENLLIALGLFLIVLIMIVINVVLEFIKDPPVEPPAWIEDTFIPTQQERDNLMETGGDCKIFVNSATKDLDFYWRCKKTPVI